MGPRRSWLHIESQGRRKIAVGVDLRLEIGVGQRFADCSARLRAVDLLQCSNACEPFTHLNGHHYRDAAARKRSASRRGG
jgi:hypothetical protein